MQAVLDAEIRVYTFKEGLLSKLAHDLLLDVSRFHIELQDGAVRADFETTSLVVLGPMRDGKLVEGLSESDKAKIRESMQGEVLRSERYPRAHLDARATRDASGVRISGSLTLCGSSQPLELTLTQASGRLRGEVELCPSRFGIRPFRALGGALKVQDRVRVRIDAREPPAASEHDVLRWCARA